jgi:molecular chaperone DnaK (HSP70)
MKMLETAKLHLSQVNHKYFDTPTLTYELILPRHHHDITVPVYFNNAQQQVNHHS